MKFSQYHFIDQLKNNLEKLGFRKPTDIQYKCIPPILNGEDLLAIAPTGTGKTAAFAIPIIHLLHTKINLTREDGIKCVVMVPTRELAIQINDVFLNLTKNTRVSTYHVIGGVEQNTQISNLQKGITILITTPGRMFDLVSQGYIKLNRVQLLVLDEADHMLERGFIKDIKDLIRFLPKRRQTLFFSATIDDQIKSLAYSLVNKPVRIQLSPKDPIAKNIDHAVVFTKMDDKRFFLERLVKEFPEAKILVFVRTKVRSERVRRSMKRVDIYAEVLNGDIAQEDRINILNDFKLDKFKMLISTDVAARGIDIPQIDYVVNYDMPEHPEDYVHRVGRTGRGTHKGFAYSFCDESELSLLEKIEEYVGKKIKILELTKDGYSEIIDLTATKQLTLKEIAEQATIQSNKRYGVKKSKKRP